MPRTTVDLDEDLLRRLKEKAAREGRLRVPARGDPIAALCLEHGVDEILTGDRDFGRFDGLTVTDPFR